MAIFHIKTPSGVVVEVNAADQQAAVAQARENWQTLPRLIAVVNDGENGRVLQSASSDTRYYAGEGYSTSDPEAIDRIMQGENVSAISSRDIVGTGGTGVGMARGALQGMTLGGGDEIVAGGGAAIRKLMGDERPIGDIYSQELSREQQRLGQFREENPVAAYGSEFAGGMMLPLKAPTTLGGAVKQGAILGGVGGALSTEGDLGDRATGAAVGAGLGGALGGALRLGGDWLGAEIENLLTRRASRRVAEGAPTTQALRDEANTLYQEMRDSGIGYSLDDFQRMVQDVEAKITGSANRQVRAGRTPLAADAIDEMKNEAARVIGIDDLDYFRQNASRAFSRDNDADNRALNLIVSGIDDMIDNIPPSVWKSGVSPDEVTANLTRARDIWGRLTRSERIQEIIRRSTEGAYAGGFEASLKGQISQILRNDKLSRGFSAEERELMRQIQIGTPIGRILAGISRLGFSPSGGRTAPQAGGAAIGGIAGAMVGGPVGAVVGAGAEMAVTTGLRALREMSLREQAELFSRILAEGSADTVIKQAPEVFDLLRNAAARMTAGGVNMTGQGAGILSERSGLTQ